MPTAKPSRSRVFINYRREDSEHAVGRLADDLRRHFAREQVFEDIASIEPGVDFAEALQQGLETCAAVLVVIGSKWLTAVDRHGRRRLDLPDDWVAHEVAESLKHPEVRVFPVLVDADMPSAEELPEPLRPLTRRQAFPLTSRHWANDVADLIACLKRVRGLAGPAAHPAEEPFAPPTTPAVSPQAPSAGAGAQAVSVPSTTEGGAFAEAERPAVETEVQPPSTEPPPVHFSVQQPTVSGWPARVPWKALAAAAVALGVVGVVYYSVRGPTTKPSAESPSALPASPQPAPGEQSFRDCEACPEMVVVPAGTFLMGSPEAEEGRFPDEGPQRRVTLPRAFAIGKYEVTFAEWDACVADRGCQRTPPDTGWGRGRQPVINVSWNDAQSYAAWLARKTGKSYRLPSEAEWEYAARAGTTTRFPWGNDPGTNRASFAGSGSRWRDRTAPVGSFEPNGFGLYDMIGNVWEWVQDCWHENYNGAPPDGSVWDAPGCDLRGVRGGSFLNSVGRARAAFRYRLDPFDRNVNNGLRVVVSPFSSGL